VLYLFGEVESNMKKMKFELFVCMLLIGTCFIVTFDIVSAEQEGDYNYTISNGEATITGYIGAGDIITIPSTLGGYPTVEIGDYAFHSINGHLITFVNIPSSVTTIGDYAFQYCKKLTFVTIPNSVTSIGEGVFVHCTSLASVTIGSSVITIGDRAFSYCPLSSVFIPDSVTTIGNYTFQYCQLLTYVTIGSNVTTIGDRVLDYCNSLTSITFRGLIAPTIVGPHWFTGPIEVRGHAYANSNFPAPEEKFCGLTMGMIIGGENKPPVANFIWMPSNPKTNQTIIFGAANSYDPDGSITLYEWDWNNDGEFEESYTTSPATHSWPQVGNYPITVRVTDNDGVTNTKKITISVSSSSENGDTDNKGTPGFELIFVICAIAITILLWKKKRNI
jgi:hypothetical protein